MSQTITKPATVANAPAASAILGLQTYEFQLDSFKITDTRSVHEDTDFVSVSLAVGTRPVVTKTKAMGNLNNGTFNVGLAFDLVHVDDKETAIFSYAIVNNGHSKPGDVEKALQTALTTLGNKGAQAAAKAAGSEIGSILGGLLGTAAVPLLGPALAVLSGWVVKEAIGIIFANCDGPVAAGVHAFTGAQLRAATSGGKTLGASDHNPGTDSATGCGANSNYFVNWSVKADPGVKAVLSQA